MFNIAKTMAHHLPGIALGAILAMAPAFASAQSSCSDKGTLSFSNASGDTITLRDATVRDLTGRGNGSLDAGVSLGSLANPVVQVSGSGGLEVSSGLNPYDFPTTGVSSGGFERRISQFWEVNYSRGDYSFSQRNRLEVQVSFSVENSDGSSSTVTVEPRVNSIRTQWYAGSNDLRRLRGDVDFNFSDLFRLVNAGTLRTRVEVCVEVLGSTNA